MSGPGPRARVGIGLVTAEMPPGSQRSPADAYPCDDVLITPKPCQPGGPRILLGGSSPAAIRRSGLLGDGFIRSRRDGNAELARDVQVQAFETDPDWRAVLAAQPGLTGRRYNELWRPTGYSPLTQAVWPDGAVD